MALAVSRTCLRPSFVSFSGSEEYCPWRTNIIVRKTFGSNSINLLDYEKIHGSKPNAINISSSQVTTEFPIRGLSGSHLKTAIAYQEIVDNLFGSPIKARLRAISLKLQKTIPSNVTSL